MVVIVSPENSKKRKKDDAGLNKITHAADVCTQEASPKKILKLAPPLDGDPSTEMSQGDPSTETSQGDPSTETFQGDPLTETSQDDPLTETSQGDPSTETSQGDTLTETSQGDPSTETSQGSENVDSQEHNAVLGDEDGGSPLKTDSDKLTDSHIQDQDVLKLDQKHVFTRLLVVFSQEQLPDKIMYNGTGYSLTAAYDEFWKTFYNSPYYSEGHEVKIPKLQSLIELELKSIVKILKRGWEDERYWPKELSRPFLESCLFEEHNINSIEPEMFLKFIEPSDKLLINNTNSVDESVLDVFKKYCSANIVSLGDDIKDICIKAAHEIMVVNMKPVIGIWREELTGLMPMSKFDFLMNPIPTPHSADTWDDMGGHSAPHELWQTFFFGWPEDKVRYYFHLLANAMHDSNCNLCGDSCFNAKHFISSCKVLYETLLSERHDAVLAKLLRQIYLAIEREGSYFSEGNDWKVLTSPKNNERYDWPKEMSILKSANKYPHIIVYSLSPEKRALLIEYSISWEFWMDTQKERKTLEYWIIKEQLEKIGFKVEYRVFVLGSRGVLIPDLYNLFDQIFRMKHSEISKAHEKISQVVLDIPYQSKYYKDLMNIINLKS